MAEESGSENAAFQILGKIEVDLAALKKSLGAAETEVRSYADKHRTIMSSLSKTLPGGGVGEGGPGGEGPGGGGGEGGAKHSPTAEFAHMARVVRHDLVPALSRLNPALAEFISAGAQSARTAVFFGGAVGAVAIAGAVVSEVIGKYVDKAKEMAAATVDATRATQLWDLARVVAGIKQINEAMTAYADNVKTLSEGPGGKSGFWGWLVAATEVAVEKITGGLDKAIEKYKIAAEAAVKIGKEYALPKSVLELDKARAEVLGEQAEYAKKTATNNQELAASYELIRKSQEAQRDATIADLRLEEEKRKREVDPVSLRENIVEKAKAIDEEIARANETKNRDRTRSGLYEAKIADLEGKKKALLGKSDTDVEAESAHLREQISEQTENKILALRLKTSQKMQASYYEEAMAFLQSREAMAAQANQAILDSETKIEEVRRKQASTAETTSAFEERMTKTWQNAIGPIEAAIAAEAELYKKRKQEIANSRRSANEESDPAKQTEKLKQAKDAEIALERGHAAASEDLNRKLNVAKADQDAKYAQGRMAQIQEMIAEEDRLFDHRVKMGQTSMYTQQKYEEEAARDPRRTLQQQEQAEERALQMKKAYADEYFKFYTSMGVNTWASEAKTHQQFLSETVSGSKAWFDEVAKIAGLYEKIHNEAKGIVGQVGAAAEAEAKRQGKFIRGPQDLAYFAKAAEERDAAVLRGGGTKPGEYLGAVGRMDMWRQQRQQFGNIGNALNFAMANPQEALADTVRNTATRPDVYARGRDELGPEAAKAAAANLKDLADAAAQAADRLRNIGERPGDGSNPRTPAEDATKSMGPNYRVLQTANGPLYTNIDPNTDSAMGRSLSLAGKRGVNP